MNASMITILAALAMSACTREVDGPFKQESEPSAFYQSASRGPVNQRDCRISGGIEINEADFDEPDVVHQGVGTYRNKAAGILYYGITFGTESMGLITRRICAWPEAEIELRDSI